MSDNGFVSGVSFYLGMYIRAKRVREKISWLWGANSMIYEGLKNKLNKDEVKKLEGFDKRLEDLFKSANWELFDAYTMGRFDLLSNEDYLKAVEALAELEHIKNTLLRFMSKTGSTPKPINLFEVEV